MGRRKKKAYKQKVRKMSILWKLWIPVSIVLLVVCSLLSAFSYLTLQEEMMQMGQLQAAGRSKFR